MSRISKDKTSWRGAGLAKRYGLITEHMVNKPRIYSRKKWCKGKRGQLHDFVVTNVATVSLFTVPERWTERRCKKCGRKEIEMLPINPSQRN